MQNSFKPALFLVYISAVSRQGSSQDIFVLLCAYESPYNPDI